MLLEPTLESLKALGLKAMAEAFTKQQQDTSLASLTFDERFGMIVDAERLFRDNRKLARRLKEAKLRLGQACIENIDFDTQRELDKSVVRSLANCRWVQEHQNIVVTGATGAGKTFLACALAQQACRKGYRAIYRRVPRLLEELNLARADGTYAKLLVRFSKVDVLILDDWGLAPLKDSNRHDLLEIMEDRDGIRSTIIASQVPRDRWHDYLGDPTVADAVLDRIVHNAHTITLKGPSRRKEKAHKA